MTVVQVKMRKGRKDGKGQLEDLLKQFGGPDQADARIMRDGEVHSI